MVTKSRRINDVPVRASDAPHQEVTNLAAPRDDHQVPHFYPEGESRQLAGEYVLFLAGAASLQGILADGNEVITCYVTEINPDDPLRKEVVHIPCALSSTDHPELFSHAASVSFGSGPPHRGPLALVSCGTKGRARLCEPVSITSDNGRPGGPGKWTPENRVTTRDRNHCPKAGRSHE